MPKPVTLTLPEPGRYVIQRGVIVLTRPDGLGLLKQLQAQLVGADSAGASLPAPRLDDELDSGGFLDEST